MRVFAIDPGNEESAYCLIDTETLKPIEFNKLPNNEILNVISELHIDIPLVIEMVACYGMPVGKEVFDTCVWIGRFMQATWDTDVHFVYRKDEKMHICEDVRAKDSNIIQALKDRFGDKGTKKEPGFFYGFSNDIWQAYACGLVYIETKMRAPT
jgi:hypothetical protein